MANYLVIVESPAKAKTIKKYLGNNYTVEASLGHLRDLPKSQIGVDVNNNFEPKYISIRGKGDLISKLKKQAKNSKKVFLATDPDREGEAISWHLCNILDINEKDNCRIAFNEITKTAVQNAVKTPRPIDRNLVDAQQARRILDRIVGYKISPILWKKVKKGLSAGRVQSVATKAICDREKEILSFESREYHTITANLNTGEAKSSFLAKFYGDLKNKIELSTEKDAQDILDKLKNAIYKVLNVKKTEKKKSPPPPFITSSLQQEASRKLGFTAKRTMQAAQQLYEGIDIKGIGPVGLITYMRTDSLRIADEARSEVSKFIGEKFGGSYLPSSQRIYKSKKGAQDAHEAIRPTNTFYEPLNIKESLTADQYKLYKLIWERFVASHMKEAVLEAINTDIVANGYIFKASGSKILFDGFMKLYTEGKDAENDEDEGMLPNLLVDQILSLKKLESKQHFTQPPARYTEATLIKFLEENGIGRPSTYAPTIITIITRGYVIREGKALKPTELGMIINDIMAQHFKNIVDIEFTANMEKQLDEVEEGSENWVEILKKFYFPFEEILKIAENEIGDVEVKDEVSDVLCEKCGRNMVIKTGRFGKFLACPGFPECRNAKPILQDTGALCPICSGKVLLKKSKNGKKYFGCENNPKCEFMTWDEPINEKCPNCSASLFKKKFKKGSKVLCLNKNCNFERGK